MRHTHAETQTQRARERARDQREAVSVVRYHMRTRFMSLGSTLSCDIIGRASDISAAAKHR